MLPKVKDVHEEGKNTQIRRSALTEKKMQSECVHEQIELFFLFSKFYFFEAFERKAKNRDKLLSIQVYSAAFNELCKKSHFTVRLVYESDQSSKKSFLLTNYFFWK